MCTLHNRDAFLVILLWSVSRNWRYYLPRIANNFHLSQILGATSARFGFGAIFTFPCTALFITRPRIGEINAVKVYVLKLEYVKKNVQDYC